MKYKHHGMSLLEILAILIIISSIVVMSVRYFMTTERNMEITQVIDQIKTMTDASYEWLESQRQFNFSAAQGGVAISMDELLNAGLIDQNEKLDPWGGNITVAPGNDPGYVKITLTHIPPQACRNLVKRLGQAKNHTTEDECGSSYSGEF